MQDPGKGHTRKGGPDRCSLPVGRDTRAPPRPTLGAALPALPTPPPLTRPERAFALRARKPRLPFPRPVPTNRLILEAKMPSPKERIGERVCQLDHLARLPPQRKNTRGTRKNTRWRCWLTAKSQAEPPPLDPPSPPVCALSISEGPGRGCGGAAGKMAAVPAPYAKYLPPPPLRPPGGKGKRVGFKPPPPPAQTPSSLCVARVSLQGGRTPSPAATQPARTASCAHERQTGSEPRRARLR